MYAIRSYYEAQRGLESAMSRDFVAALNVALDDALVRLKPALPPEN